jgi:phage shock protein C
MGKLVRIQGEAKIAGVCAGLGKYFGIDPTILRIIFVLSSFIGVGSPILIYFLLAILMPRR